MYSLQSKCIISTVKAVVRAAALSMCTEVNFQALGQTNFFVVSVWVVFFLGENAPQIYFSNLKICSMQCLDQFRLRQE